jgi:hypothetical protein
MVLSLDASAAASDPGGQMSAARPTWQREPCPPWCVRDHDEDDIPLDRYHQASPSVVPVLASSDPETMATGSLVSIDLTIRIGRHAGDVLDWIAIEPLPTTAPRLVLTAESAARLADEISDQLAQHTALDQE